MKHHFIQTENHRRLGAAVAFMEERGSLSSPICLIHGEPGVGKTRNISNYGSENHAIQILGHVGMNLDGLIWAISKQLGVKHLTNRTPEMEKQVEALRAMGSPLIFDEAQYGLSMRSKKVESAGIEYVRQLGEMANVHVFLVCHNSEVARFSDSAHIRTRIAHRVELHGANEQDTVKFVQELSEVDIGLGAAEMVYRQTGGKYRLIENAISALERIAKIKKLARVELQDVSNLTLVIDHEEGLIPKLSKVAKNSSIG